MKQVNTTIPWNKQVYPGLGCASLSGEGGGYGFGNLSEKESEILIRSAWDAGIEVYDTAPIYGFGLSEERLGRYLPREAKVLSKGGVTWHENRRVNMTNDPMVIERMFLDSLRRLQRDSIEMYLIHWPDSKVDIRKPYDVLKKFQDQGMVKYIGLSNPDPEDIVKASGVAPVAVLQFEASFLQRQKLLELKQNLKVADVIQNSWITGWGTLAKGVLTGRVYEGRKYDASDARSWAPWWKKSDLQEQIQRSQPFLKIAQDFQVQSAALALFYSTEVLGVHAPLIGIKSTVDLGAIQDWKTLNEKKNPEIIQALQRHQTSDV